VTSRHFVYGGWEILPQDFIVALYDLSFKWKPICRVCLPLHSRIKRARGEAKGREMKGQLFEEKRGSESRIRSVGTANQSSSARGWFCSFVQTGWEGVSRVSDIYIGRSPTTYCHREREGGRSNTKRIQAWSLEFQRARVRMSFWRNKDEGKIYPYARGYNFSELFIDCSAENTVLQLIDFT